MGVLHIALPVSPHARPSGRKHAIRRIPRPFPEQKSVISAATPVLQQISPEPTPRDTLPVQGKPLPSGVKLERTPEQDAANEALARLVRQCMAGDSQAWQQLVVSQHRRIYAICYRFTGSGSDAEDLTQDVFIKLYKNLASFDLQKGSFQTWITTLTRNLLVDHFRRTRLDRASDSLDATYDGEEDGPTMADRLADPRASQETHVAGLELKARIQGALKQLSPELREAVILRDLEDMDYKEISQVLRIPEGTVKSRISRGRGELARLLQRIES
jgi:RNA polymerase sigma-70 factor (ECF subfamily)